MSKSNKKKMERLRKRQLKIKKRLEKIALLTITVAVLIIVGIHYAGSGSGANHTVNNAKQTLSNFSVALINGGTISTKSLEGGPLVVWLMTTWCSSCADTSELLISQYYSSFRSGGIRLLQIENYNDLNQQGESLPAFVSQYGGANEPGWYIGTAAQSVTLEYNPSSALDIYYMVNSQGDIVGSGQGLGANLNSVLETLG
ncbi:MAG: hypothetical protein AAE986_06680 [Thermoplasmataceae archaeon]|jgi:thiol-disulfide isomerase/thioredoxin